MPKHTHRPKRTRKPMRLSPDNPDNASGWQPSIRLLGWLVLQIALTAFLIAIVVGIITVNDNQGQDIRNHGLEAHAIIVSSSPCYIGRDHDQYVGNEITVRFTDNQGKVRKAHSQGCVDPENGNETTVWYMATDPHTIVTREDLPRIAKRLHDTQTVGYIAFAIIVTIEVYRWYPKWKRRPM